MTGPRQFHEVVMEYRIQRGWTRVQMGKHMGVSDNTVKGWENRTAFPQLGPNRDRVCEVLGFDHVTLHDQELEYDAYRASLD